MRWLSSRRNLFVMLAPAILIYSLYIIASVVIAVGYSFTKYSGIGKAKFLGFSNYTRVFADTSFQIALRNSIIILFVALVLLVVFGFLIANLLKMKWGGANVCKAFIFSPAVIAPIIVGITWIFILDPEIGLINAVLRQYGLESWTRLWIGGDTLSPYSFAFVFFWRQLGYICTIFISGLNLIPGEVYESAGIDGANAFQRMWYITIPMIRATFTIVVVLVITESFKIFEIVLQLTNGGPNHLSEVLVTYTYMTTFKGGEYGYGMALATMTFLISLIFSLVYMFTARSKEL